MLKIVGLLLAALAFSAFPPLYEGVMNTPLPTVAAAFCNVLIIVFTWLATKPISDRQSRKEWLPFAEKACEQAIVLGAHADRYRRQQLARCGEVRRILTTEQQEQFKPALILMDSQCNDAADKLLSLGELIRSERRSWESFIRMHCTGSECKQIDRRLKDYEAECAVPEASMGCAGTK